MLDGRLFYYDYNNQENYILIDRMQMEQVSQTFALFIYAFLGHCKTHIQRR